SSSPQLKEKINQMDYQLQELSLAIKEWQPEIDKPNYSKLKEILNSQDKIESGLTEAFTFVEAVHSADVQDKHASALYGQLFDLISRQKTVTVSLTKKFVRFSDQSWQALLKLPFFSPIAFVLDEDRTLGKELLSESEEKLINQLSIDGFQGWSNHYDSLVAEISIPYTDEEGNRQELSIGQAQNKMYGDANPQTRQSIFNAWEKAWNSATNLFADTLNHLAGFRLADYQAHDIDDFLKKPLEYNRMKKETLDAMWKAVSDHKQPFIRYLNRKAELFGKDKLDWQDIEAPVLIEGSSPRNYPFDEGVDFIIDNFAKFSPKMAIFAKHALENQWVEAEDRPGKAPGGYCSDLPESQESRIFMTYSNSPNEVSTLAHELGHAFHSDVMRDLPERNQHYAMNVAETASTFAEMIVADATVKDAKTKEDKITLLDTKIQNALAMFLNIHACFLFETQFYTERKKGIITKDRLNEIMLKAQKEAYQDSLGSYHTSFWSSKLHFYIADVPFYNFPYTFGYLFSLGIYARSLEEGTDFEDDYIALLRDTGSMTSEQLAEKHLGVDLTEHDFWESGINIMAQDVETFLSLTDSYVSK
ncbi:MAG: M3 family oligoendopeptidase, partial [Pisciglobus halotolerans]|nr:M3 family oligoendopeptidase [Pisciglobus halotolerans]